MELVPSAASCAAVTPRQWANWERIAAQAGMDSQRCPRCQRQLVIYQDNALGGEWLACHGCFLSGKPYELAAVLWGVEVPVALVRLLGWPEAPPEEEITPILLRLQRQEAARTLLLEAQQRGLTSRQALRALRMDLAEPSLSWEEWRRRGGAPFGLVERATLEAFVGPGRLKKRWTQALVAPLYDLPGRLAALWLATDELNGRQQAIVELWPSQRRGGMLLLPEALRVGTGPLLVALDFLQAFHCQLRHLSIHEELLPVVGVASDLAVLPWLRDGRELVVWAQKPDDPQLFRHAVALDARVAFSAQADPQRPVRDLTAREWLKKTLREATSWQSALDIALAKLPAVEAATFLATTGLSGSQRQRYCQGAGEALGGHLSRALRALPQRVTVGRHVVLDRDDGWYLERSDECIASWKLVLDEILAIGSPPEQHYVGRLVQRAEEIPFAVTGTAFERNPFRFLESELLRHGKLSVFAANWSRHALRIAKELYKPQAVARPTLFGIDPAQRTLTLPRYSVDLATGQTTQTSWVPPSSVFVGFDPPAEEAVLSHDDWELLAEDTPTQRWFWTLTWWVVQWLLSPLTGQAPLPLAVYGEELAGWGSLLGLASFKQAITSPLPHLGSSGLYERSKTTVLALALSGQETASYLAEVPPVPALTLVDRWHTCSRHYLTNVVARFSTMLQESLKRRILQTPEDWGRWLQKRLGRAHSLVLPCATPQTPWQQSRALVELLTELVREGRLPIVSVDFACRGRVQLVRRGKKVGVVLDRLEKLLKRKLSRSVVLGLPGVTSWQQDEDTWLAVEEHLLVRPDKLRLAATGD